MKILSSNSIKGAGNYNNDIMNNLNNFCYVINGATALFNDNLFYNTSDLYEYMNLLKKNISDTSSINENLVNGIIKSNKYLKNIDKFKEYELPTFAIAAVKETNKEYQLYLLCDCLISVLYKDGRIENIEDHRFDEIKSQYRNENKKISQLDISSDEKFELKKPTYQKYRKLANAINGYPVGSTNPNSIKNGITKTIDKKNVEKIIICSDGLYNKIGFPNDNSYFDKKKLEEKISNIKVGDDLTYMLIDTNNE